MPDSEIVAERLLEEGENDFHLHFTNFSMTISNRAHLCQISIDELNKNQKLKLDEHNKKVETLTLQDQEIYKKVIHLFDVANDQLFKEYNSSTKSKELEDVVKDYSLSIKVDEFVPKMFREMMLTYLISNFEVFLYYCFESVFLMRPELLKNEKNKSHILNY